MPRDHQPPLLQETDEIAPSETPSAVHRDEIAVALDARMDVLIVRKIGVPWNPEYAMGAIASDGIVVLDETLMNELGLSRADLAPVLWAE